MQILAEQLKTQYFRGENVCQGEKPRVLARISGASKDRPTEPNQSRACLLSTHTS